MLKTITLKIGGFLSVLEVTISSPVVSLRWNMGNKKELNSSSASVKILYHHPHLKFVGSEISSNTEQLLSSAEQLLKKASSSTQIQSQLSPRHVGKECKRSCTLPSAISQILECTHW